jgi:lipopolysaccharide transport system ATP-binding protein
MHAITRLCPRAILLDQSRLTNDGPAPQVVATYLNSELGTTAAREWRDPETAPGGSIARLLAVRALNKEGGLAEAVEIREPISLEMKYEVLTPGHMLLPHFHVFNEESVHVFPTLDRDPQWRLRSRPKGIYLSKVLIPGNFLTEGTFYIHANLITLNPNVVEFNVPDAVVIQVVDSLDGDTARGDWVGALGGVVRPVLEWSTRVYKS